MGKIFLRNLLYLTSSFVVIDALSCWKSYDNVSNPYPNPDSVSPSEYEVIFDTNIVINDTLAEPIVISVTREWAPLGADRFYSLSRDQFFINSAFFRVVPNFVVQFGIAAKPEMSEKWNTPITDDPVIISNTAWTVSFATSGANTRTTQIFINLDDNTDLDSQGFSPFGVVTSGHDTILAITNPTPGDSDGVDQGMYQQHGNEWILQEYPDISLVLCDDPHEVS